MKFDRERFAENLNKVMKFRNVSGTELAERTGMSLVTISKFRNGKGKPRIESVCKICEALDVEVFELLDF